MREGYIYFIGPKAGGPIKIGFSQDPAKRFRHIDCGSPIHLELLAVVPGNSDDEKATQNKFLNHNYRNEWFHPVDELLQFIEAIKLTGVLPDDCRGNEKTKKLVFSGRPRNHRQLQQLGAA